MEFLTSYQLLDDSPRFLNPQQLSETTAAQQKKRLPLKLTPCHLKNFAFLEMEVFSNTAAMGWLRGNHVVK